MDFGSIIEQLSSQHFAVFSANSATIENITAFFRRNSYRTTTTILEMKTSENARQFSLSKKHGTGGFPFHTDFAFRAIPPRFVVLCNLSDSTFTRTTRVCALKMLNGDFIELLKGSIWQLQTSRGRCLLNGEISLGSNKGFRWDTDFLYPDNDHALAAIKMALPIMQKSSIDLGWEPNSALLIDNWNCVHARSFGDDADDNRKLLRIEAWGNGRMVS